LIKKGAKRVKNHRTWERERKPGGKKIKEIGKGKDMTSHTQKQNFQYMGISLRKKNGGESRRRQRTGSEVRTNEPLRTKTRGKSSWGKKDRKL